jgi:hypothetical protein
MNGGVGLAEPIGDMPRNRLALTVGVGREIDVLLILGGGLDAFDDFGLAGDHVVFGLEAVLDVDAQLALRQIDHMPDRRSHYEIGSEVALDSLRLGRRFDDDQVFCHSFSPSSQTGAGGPSLLMQREELAGMLRDESTKFKFQQ